jgi:hypothetical protein
MPQPDAGATQLDHASRAATPPAVRTHLHDLSLDDYARAAAILGVALYVLGLLTVNVYLFQIGASDFSLLRTRFILAGALAVFFLTVFAMWVAALAVAISAVMLAWARRQNGPRTSPSFTGPTLLVALLIAGFLVTVAQLRTSSPFTLSTSAIAAIDGDLEWLVISGVVLPLLVLGIGRWACRRPTGQASASIELAATPILLTFAFLLVLFLFVDFFAASIFPAVPEQFGGAKPKPVTLFLKPTANTLISLRDDAPEAANAPLKVQLIWEGEQGYLVQGLAEPNSPYVQIARDQVAAVEYPGKGGP